MVSQALKTRVTPEKYLALERAAAEKGQLFDGEIFAMAGGTPQHSLIAASTIGELVRLLRGGPCRVYTSDLRVASPPAGLYTYPDVIVVCGEPQYYDAHGDVLLNPKLLVEVLSRSTEAFDRGKKFAGYQQMASLTDYLLVAQDEPRVEHFSRQAAEVETKGSANEGGGNHARWLLTTATGLEAVLPLPSLDCALALAEIYAGVVFPPPPAPPANGLFDAAWASQE